MKCPKCGADLNTVDYHGVQVDRCPECDGVWFDAGEVESLVEKDTGVIDVLRSMIRTVS
jgi:Zn-finger nucleic acid-binding protein